MPPEALSFREAVSVQRISMQDVDNPDQAPLRPARVPRYRPDIHEGERLCARLLHSLLRVSEKNSSRKPSRVCYCWMGACCRCASTACDLACCPAGQFGTMVSESKKHPTAKR